MLLIVSAEAVSRWGACTCLWHACGLSAFPDVEAEGEHQFQAKRLGVVREGSLQTPAQRSNLLPFSHKKLFSFCELIRWGRRQRKGKDVFYIGWELAASSNTEIMRYISLTTGLSWIILCNSNSWDPVPSINTLPKKSDSQFSKREELRFLQITTVLLRGSPT